MRFSLRILPVLFVSAILGAFPSRAFAASDFGSKTSDWIAVGVGLAIIVFFVWKSTGGGRGGGSGSGRGGGGPGGFGGAAGG